MRWHSSTCVSRAAVGTDGAARGSPARGLTAAGCRLRSERGRERQAPPERQRGHSPLPSTHSAPPGCKDTFSCGASWVRKVAVRISRAAGDVAKSTITVLSSAP
eukprot:TRINITY_DN22347_c0_g1_i2.p1 TRINITY_DN22347_c0_g1~~TRINITY_DN22347_c0_g1_i2.p1  ORF type:complete len:104 (+),score=9.30 TRINITY_DN22347_c0_g1_i2:175-486(+)